MQKSDFDGKIGKRFKLGLDDEHRVVADLIAIEDLPEKDLSKINLPEGVEIRENPFCLVFLEPHDIEANADGEELKIFASPFKEDDKGIHYESIFN